MLTIEKVIILKSVSIFSQIPEETLIEVASLAQEREYPAGAQVFAQGDIGTSLYVIITGQIRIHLGAQELAILGQRQVFGELAALDPEPRSASASVLEETLLLEIDRNTLYELLGEYTELAQGILQILCQRLRATPRATTALTPTAPSGQSLYESVELVDRYLLFHYGTPEQQAPLPDFPASGFDFPSRCVSECLDLGKVKVGQRALDLGCSVGRSAFELSRYFQQVLAVDLSKAFIAAAKDVQRQQGGTIKILQEGQIFEDRSLTLPPEVNPERVEFQFGDALHPDPTWGTFDCVLAANLLDRVPDPKRLLEVLTRLTNRGGQLLIISPYSWLEEYTPRKNWPTGSTFEFLRQHLEPNFDLHRQKNLPFLIREHARKFQFSSAEATVWIKR